MAWYARESCMASVAGRQHGTFNPRAKNAIRGAYFGFLVDIYLPIVLLAPATAYFVAPEMSTVENNGRFGSSGWFSQCLSGHCRRKGAFWHAR
jgi:hypothetical protein